MRSRATRLVGVLLLLSSVLAACARPLAISELRARSQELQGRVVTVEGQVEDSIALPLLGDRYYRIDDGSGRIWVQTRGSAPAEGQRVRVTGTLAPGIRVPGLEAGMVIVESSRR